MSCQSLELTTVEVGDPNVAELSFTVKLRQDSDEVGTMSDQVGTVNLVKIDMVHAEPAERILTCSTNPCG